MKIYEVTWYDAHFNDASYSLDDIDIGTTPWIISTVGYFVGESRIDFKIAQEYHLKSKKYGHIMSIPLNSIIKKKLLRGNK